MTDSIQSIISQISHKAKGLHNLLVSEREKSANLSSKNQHIQNELDQKTAQIEELENKLKAQEERLMVLAEQDSGSANSPSVGNTHEIDELVKEIEYCISQLRK
jgi:methyl-accepting chemotaxis protein